MRELGAVRGYKKKSFAMKARAAIAIIAALVTLRIAERLLAILTAPPVPQPTTIKPTIQHAAQKLHSVEEGYLPPPPPPSVGITSMVAVRARIGDSMQRELHVRPLPLHQSSAIWQPAVGRWLTEHVGSRIEGPPSLPPMRACPGGCGTDGVCDALLGICRCVSGRAGVRCEREERWRCNADDGRYLWSRCAGECDTRRGYCFCGARGAYPDRPLLQCEPIGIEKVLMPWKLDNRNKPERFPWEAIWGRSPSTGKAGWCNANASTGEQPAAHCACRLDGRDGYLCQHHVAMFCLNQCNFRGRCLHGFCLCESGWWGSDCSIPMTRAPSATAAATPVSTPVSMPVSSAPAMDASPASRTGVSPAAPEAATHEGAPSGQVRPLIYVYELPPRFTTERLQRRHDKMFCTHRTYLQKNRTQYAYGIYQGYVLEVLLHEWLLASPHRTLDPALADWFYVPVYASCAMVTAIFTTPDTTLPRYRTALAAELYAGAHAHVMHTWPYWNASGGTDHIWTFGYDEGACFAPMELWPSMIISHWGNTMSKHNRCTTTYDGDRWDVERDPWTHQPLQSLTGGHRCYEPQKDVIMPSFRELTTFLPLDTSRRPPPRRALFFFSGDLGSPPGAINAGPHVSPNYSMGIRQRVYRAAAAAKANDVHVVGHFAKDWWHVQYHAAMHNSTFCGAFPGDGWSGGISSAVFAGCVPVIIMDGIELPFENVLHYPSFSVRIAEADVDALPAILRAIPPARVAQLQAGLALVRPRFGYASLAHNELRLARGLGTEPQAYMHALAKANEQEEDALQTVLRVLLYRAASRRHSRTNRA